MGTEGGNSGRGLNTTRLGERGGKRLQDEVVIIDGNQHALESISIDFPNKVGDIGPGQVSLGEPAVWNLYEEKVKAQKGNILGLVQDLLQKKRGEFLVENVRKGWAPPLTDDQRLIVSLFNALHPETKKIVDADFPPALPAIGTTPPQLPVPPQPTTSDPADSPRTLRGLAFQCGKVTRVRISIRSRKVSILICDSLRMSLVLRPKRRGRASRYFLRSQMHT